MVLRIFLKKIRHFQVIIFKGKKCEYLNNFQRPLGQKLCIYKKITLEKEIKDLLGKNI